MSIVDYLLAPRKDYRGMNTPSESSRLLLIVVIIYVSYWSWPLSEGIIFVWLAIITFVSTPILFIGWIILSYAGQNRESRKLTPSWEKIKKTKK
ncbi:MAG: hypothetical protein HOJ64_02310 [Euryarchaeota archaeon]|jgi:hypothetical protein|nr:hypothetical protein [Euryarchaeota archaeon]MBT4802477.1 hypothetical protein [Euryarchaeota archaeon]MBT5613687.1 hypothetical protein [Euryarchaeota archaeon]MBT6684608.1 hypothetical protein [Euryarchaeota archaeon]MBT7413321.1 hypothetical protein [Euryarchaeota archaeon]